MDDASRRDGRMGDGIKFTDDGKLVRVYPGAAASPVVYLNCFQDPGDQIAQLLRQTQAPSCSLVTISNLSWDDDMTPWDCPPLSADDNPCHGKADEYLEWMLSELVPATDRYLSEKPCYRALAGYSLAGLFSVYALYRTGAFDRAASMSGSLWYPDFLEYTRAHKMVRQPSCLYFSLGDRECRTSHPLLKTVQERTEALARDCAAAGIETVFELNPGNHFQKATRRTVNGLAWMLSHGKGTGSQACAEEA